MKKLILFGFIAGLALTSCKNNSEQKESTTPELVPPANTSVTKTDTVKTQPDGTSIKLNEQGISIENKDGSKKNNVSISKDSLNIEISKPK